ncbi:MAG TPA: LPS export ABC transporter permease LptG [Steroidobacteraceae bacterium]|nr:LPS export ABC transporter permease LptG [Steroidobacteraceae bacterium]
MNILDRYIVARILAMTALVMLVIIALAVLVTFIAEQGDTGTGHYGSLDALWFSLMSVPQQAWELMPIGALIGSMLGLGGLASGSELTVARAAGVSVARLAVSVFIAGVLLVGIEVVLGELLAPPLQQVARQEKAAERFSDASIGGGSAWVRDGNQILDVEQSQAGEIQGGMLIFELSPDHHLVAMGRAARALPGADHRWLLRGYVESRFGRDGRVSAFAEGVRTLDSNVSGQFLHLAMSEPGELASAALWSLIGYYRANSLDPKPYLFAFWSRIARTGAIAFAVLLAVPFVLGPMRSSGTGVRLLAGLLLGLGFFFMQRFIESGTIVFDLNPVLLAWLPTTVLVVVTFGLLARVR